MEGLCSGCTISVLTAEQKNEVRPNSALQVVGDANINNPVAVTKFVLISISTHRLGCFMPVLLQAFVKTCPGSSS